MTTNNNNHNNLENLSETKNLLSDSIKVLSDLTKKDVERLYNIKGMQGAEIYHSNLMFAEEIKV